MASVKENAPLFLKRLTKALVDTLNGSGIQARVLTEPVPTTKLYRVAVFSPQFEAMKHSERQSLAWRIAERTLSPDEQLRISMILTLTDEEEKGK